MTPELKLEQILMQMSDARDYKYMSSSLYKIQECDKAIKEQEQKLEMLKQTNPELFL